MQAQLVNKAQHVRTLVEKVAEAVRKGQTPYPNTPYELNLTLQINFGTLSDSETLSQLDKIESALARFSKEQGIAMQLHCQPVAPAEGFLTETVDSSFKTAMELANSVPKLVSLEAPAPEVAPTLVKA